MGRIRIKTIGCIHTYYLSRINHLADYLAIFIDLFFFFFFWLLPLGVARSRINVYFSSFSLSHLTWEMEWIDKDAREQCT